MQEILTDIVIHLSKSHQQLSRMLDANRYVTVRMAELVHSLPDAKPRLDELGGLLGSSSLVTKSIVSYLNSLAELEDSMADSLTHIVRAMGEGSYEE